jgi:hypothetical protein
MNAGAAASVGGDKVREHPGQLFALVFLQEAAGALDRDVRLIPFLPR